jgi:hypothetical protein
MRIGLINVKKLTRARDTFRPGWRIFIAAVFLLSVFLWFAALHQLKSLASIVDDATLRTRGLILSALILPPLAAALFRKNDFGRLFFVLAIIFNLLTIILITLVCVYAAATTRGAEQALASILLLLMLSLLVYQVGPCYVLILSLLPFGRWKAFRRQVKDSLRLWSGEWKGEGEPRWLGPGETPYLNAGTPYRLALGWLSLAFGVATFLASLFSLVNSEFVPAVRRLEFSSAWRMLSGFETTPPSDWPEMAQDATNSMLMLLTAFFFFFLFGYFLAQWQRENVVIYRTPLLRHMTSADLLLLRSFGDDAKYVGRTHNALMGLFRLYGWGFTFEELVVNRMKYLGQVRLLDVEHKRKELLSKWGVRFIARVLGPDRLEKFLTVVFPAIWYRLPAKGGARYYIKAEENDEKWKEEIKQAMSLARMVIMVLGTTDSVEWEMRQLLGHPRLSEKTLFVMPPLIRKKNYRARWEQFTDFVCATRDCDRRLMEKVNPKRVLAVIISGDTLVVITSKRTLDTYYESALDVATILAVAGPSQTAKLIPGYLK